MSKSEIEPKPVVGDDGELLEADISFPSVGYVEKDSLPVEVPVSLRIGKWLFLAIIGMLSVCSLAWMISNPKSASDASNALAPTQFADHPVYLHTQFQLPQAQSATAWDSGLTNMSGLSWSHDQSQIAITYGQKQLAIWNIERNQYTTNQSQVTAFDWSPTDSHLFVAADLHNIAIYNNEPTVTLRTILKPSSAFSLPPAVVRWSSDGLQIAALSQDRQTLDIFYVSNGELATEKQVNQPIRDIQWSPVGSVLLSVQSDNLLYIQPKNIHIAQLKQEWNVSPEGLLNWKLASFAPDGQKIALVGLECDSKLAVFDRLQSSPKWIKRIANYTTQNCSLNTESEMVWSPQINQIATFIRGDDSVYVWDSRIATVLDRLIPARNRPLVTIAWSPDGRYLTIGSGSLIVLWSPA